MKNPFSRVHISRRLNVPTWQKVLFKAGSILLAFLLCGLLCMIFSEDNAFGGFFESLIYGTFASTKQFVFFLEEFALLIGLALALLPTYKMRFWNLGADGQALLGGFGAAVISRFVGPHVPGFICVILMIIAAVVLGGLWSLIPAIFRAKWGTNETLFTLMLNYIAYGVVIFFIRVWDPSHGLMNGLTHGMFPLIFGQRYIINIIVVAVIFALMFIYIKKSKHGYELSVVGENTRTAKYIGINDKKVILRTAILSGAICGIIGLLIVGYCNSVSWNLTEGRGFTAVLIVWLGHFNFDEIGISALLVAFLAKGSSRAQTFYNLDSSFSAVCTGLFFLTILAFEFFLNYKIILAKDVENDVRKESKQ